MSHFQYAVKTSKLIFTIKMTLTILVYEIITKININCNTNTRRDNSASTVFAHVLTSNLSH